MTMSNTAAKRRVSLSLDTTMPFDALIMNRLERLPQSRRHEWLRGLLVQGFQAECRLLRELEEEGAAQHPALPVRAIDAQRLPTSDESIDVDRVPTPSVPAVAAADSRSANGAVSLAMLRKVIG
ncbi:MAG: hypothetical protein U5K38_14355 [Woeseiaceae bacterium]|nr:hypothetical protein [Woeseiaceae bacterium]